MSLARYLPANICYLAHQINSCLFTKNSVPLITGFYCLLINGSYFSFLEAGRGGPVSSAHSVLRFFSYYSPNQV